MLNVVALTGRLTYEPELKATSSGVSVVNFQIACDRNYQAKGQERQADFIDCQAWRQTAEFIQRYFRKGQMIAIEGKIQTNNYTDKDGIRRKAVTVVVDNVSFCGSKNESGSKGESAPQGQTRPGGGYEEILDDDDYYADLPF